jgi:FkbM family methyltransferase
MKDIFFERNFYSDFEQSPLVLVDVGASGGLQPKWSRAARFLRVVEFEPDKDEFQRLVATGAGNMRRVLNTALYKRQGMLPFYRTRDRQWSSILKPNHRVLDKFPHSEGHDIEQVGEIEVSPLDQQLTQADIQDVDVLKLDTQGSELFILEGAQQTLSRVFTVEVEVEFVPLYEDQPLFSDVEAFLKRFGFQLFDLNSRYWKRKAGKDCGNPKGQLVCADALFLRTSESFLSMLQAGGRANSRQKLLRALSLCAFYGYIDYALELLEGSKDLLSKEQVTLLDRILKNDIPISTRIPNMRGRWRAAEFFYRLYKLFRPTRGIYSSGGRGLGNVD